MQIWMVRPAELSFSENLLNWKLHVTSFPHFMALTPNPPFNNDALVQALTLQAWGLSQLLLDLPVPWELHQPEKVTELLLKQGYVRDYSSKPHDGNQQELLIQWFGRIQNLHEDHPDDRWSLTPRKLKTFLTHIFQKNMIQVLEFLAQHHPQYLIEGVKKIQKTEEGDTQPLPLFLMSNDFCKSLDILLKHGWTWSDSLSEKLVNQVISLEGLELLKSYGVDFKGTPGTPSETLIEHVVRNHKWKTSGPLIKWLLKEKSSLPTPNALFSVAREGTLADFKKLTKSVNDLSCRDAKGQTLLHAALLAGHYATADYLAHNRGLSWLENDESGFSPLDYFFSEEIESSRVSSAARTKERTYWLRRWPHLEKLAIDPETSVLRKTFQDPTRCLHLSGDWFGWLLKHTPHAVLQSPIDGHLWIDEVLDFMEKNPSTIRGYSPGHALRDIFKKYAAGKPGDQTSFCDSFQSPQEKDWLSRALRISLVNDLTNQSKYAWARHDFFFLDFLKNEKVCIGFGGGGDHPERSWWEQLFDVLKSQNLNAAIRGGNGSKIITYSHLLFSLEKGAPISSNFFSVNNEGETLWDQWIEATRQGMIFIAAVPSKSETPNDHYNHSHLQEIHDRILKSFGAEQAFLFTLSLSPLASKAETAGWILAQAKDAAAQSLWSQFIPSTHPLFTSQKEKWVSAREHLHALKLPPEQDGVTRRSLWQEWEKNYLSKNVPVSKTGAPKRL